MITTMRLTILVFTMVSCLACGSSPTAPTPPPTPQPPATVTITGHVTTTIGGQALGGVQAALGTTSATTDAGGSFTATMLPQASIALALTGVSIVPRTLRVAAMTSRAVDVDAIGLGGLFDMGFYRQMVRDDFDFPGSLRPIRRWTKAPSIYLRTVDDTGATIDARTMASTEAALRESVPAWTAGTFNVATLERGTDTRERQAGWITVRWFVDASVGKCGNADVAVEGGTIDLYPRVPRCRCDGGPEIRPRLVRHEVGHAMGFWHTASNDDLMNQTMWTCDLQPTARERYHASIAYARPVGNSDPDIDPAGVVTLAPMRVH